MVRRERRAALRSALADLRRYQAAFSLDRLLADTDSQRLVLHAMYVAVQACVDEALDMCARHRLASDGSYRDAFLALGRSSLIPAELAGALSRWASMRNVLAHFYPVLDLRRVHEALGQTEPLEAFEGWLLTQPVG